MHREAWQVTVDGVTESDTTDHVQHTHTHNIGFIMCTTFDYPPTYESALIPKEFTVSRTSIHH